MAHRHDVHRFNRMAPRYERHWLQHVVFEPVQRTVIDLAQESVPRPAAILDIGCGTGRLLRSAEQCFPNASLIGVDAAPEMVKQAEASIPNGSAIRFQQAVAEKLPFPDAQFDLIFSTLTFHHWQDQQKAMAEVARLLGHGGRWLIADLMPTGMIGLVLRLFRVHRFPQRAGFDAMLLKAGLKVIRERRVRGLGGQLGVLAIGS